MSQAPFLHREDIREEVQRYFDSARDHYLIALHGTGIEESIQTEASGPVHVFPVGSELELRQRLLELKEPDSRAVLLVPWRHDLPMDIAGRFALGGRVRSIGRDARLKRLFGVRSVSEEALSSPLADHLLAHPGEVDLTIGELELTERRMWETWLARVWDLDARGGLALDSLLAWAAVNGRGPSFEQAMAQSPDVLRALEAFLTQSLGPAGPVVLRFWRLGDGERPLQYALLFEALRQSKELGVWVRSKVRDVLRVEGEGDLEQVAGQLGEAVSTALPLYASAAAHDHKAPVRGLLERADALASAADAQVRAALVASARLPSGWNLRLAALGDQLLTAADDPTREKLAVVLAAKKELEGHASYVDDENDRTVQRAEMAVRLLAWLVSDRSALERGTAEPAHADVERLGRWYAEEGGFIDWARRLARGPATSSFDKGVHAVVGAADAEREKLDLRFAGALAPWVSARRPAHQVVPIEQVSRRVVASFLEGNPDRKLLVLLLDGMAWAQAVEILDSLGEQGDGWGPAAWHTKGHQHKLGSARTPVVLAGLPTVTEVSRAAFFAGKLMTDGKSHTTSKDPERWRENSNLNPFFEGAEYPRLFLRGEGHEAHGVASQAALTAIAQSDQRVVAVVINAIDASLKSDTQQWHPWKAHNVRSLPELLAAAKEHGRTVLLASDHGHVPSDRFQEKAGASTGGARWQPLERAEDPVEAFEVKLSGEGVWCPKGAEAIALLADDKRRYGGGAHAGEHGGATLAEVVAPCVLIHWDDPHGAQVDPDRVAQGLVKPDWWHFEVSQPAPAVVPEPPPRRKQRRSSPPKPDSQLILAHVDADEHDSTQSTAGAQASTSAKAQPGLSAAAKGLESLPTIKALGAVERKQVLAAVDYILERDGIAQLSAFASHLELPAFRVQGFIARRLQKVLNLDGFQVVTYDQAQVRLDREVLEQQFGVKL